MLSGLIFLSTVTESLSGYIGTSGLPLSLFEKASAESPRKEKWPTTLLVGPNMSDVVRPTTMQSSAAQSRSCAPSWNLEERRQLLESRNLIVKLMDCAPGWGRHLSMVNMFRNCISFVSLQNWLLVAASQYHRCESKIKLQIKLRAQTFAQATQFASFLKNHLRKVTVH